MPLRQLKSAWSLRVLGAGLLAAVTLVVVGWFDYTSTRSELLGLLRDQAASLRATVAAAARSNVAASAQAEAQAAERLLDNARLLAELDRRGALTQALLDDVARRNHLFRVLVVAPDGSREHTSAGGAAPQPGWGFGGQGLLAPLLAGTAQETVSSLHNARWGAGARIAAGVRRANGGAIVLNVDASDVASLRQQASLETLMHDIAGTAAQLAYLVFEHDGLRVVEGVAPPALGPSAPTAAERLEAAGRASRATSAPAIPLVERELLVEGRPVIEFAGNVAIGESGTGELRLGLRLDDVRRTE